MNRQQLLVVKLLKKAEELLESKNLNEYTKNQYELLNLSERFKNINNDKNKDNNGSE